MVAQHPRTKGDVFEDALWKWIRPLEDHADLLPEGDDIRSRLVDVLAIEGDRSINASVRNELIQTVKGSEESRFSASGRPYQSGNLALSDKNVDIFKGLGQTIVEIEPFCLHFYDGAMFRHERTFLEAKVIQFCLKLTNYEALIK
jgi:hypothetical protein